jgi:hypothetical protein
MVDSHMDNANESFGYGTLLCLDGASADSDAIADVGLSRRFLTELVSAVEETCSDPAEDAVVVVDAGPDGYSAALVAGETSVMLHVFVDLRAVALQLFSPHHVSAGQVTESFLATFGVRRYQSGVRGRGLVLPTDPAALARLLTGQRGYTRLRMIPAEPVTL